MNILSIIAKKREKKELSKEEIDFFIKEYTNETITDYQAAALIMAIYINGMTNDEITNLTLAMANSGEKLDLSDISGNIVDKHSTGGVGDKITLILWLVKVVKYDSLIFLYKLIQIIQWIIVLFIL